MSQGRPWPCGCAQTSTADNTSLDVHQHSAYDGRTVLPWQTEGDIRRGEKQPDSWRRGDCVVDALIALANKATASRTKQPPQGWGECVADAAIAS